MLMFLGVMVLITMVDPRWRLSNKSLMTLCTTHPLARLFDYLQWPELCATSAECTGAVAACASRAEGSSSHKMIWLEWSLSQSWFLGSVSLYTLLSTFTFSQFTTSSFQTRYNIKMASNINVIFIYLCCPWIVEICKVAENGAGYVITKSDDLYMGSVTATLAHQVQTFSLLSTPSSSS